MKKVFLTVSDTNQLKGHGAFSRHQRMAEALVKQGHAVFWISPPGYEASGVNIIPLSLSKLPNILFIGLYIKLMVTFIKNYNLFKAVDAVFTIREYDAFCMLAIPFLRKTPKIFLSRGDAISILTINKPSNIKIIKKLKTNISLFVYPFIQRVVLKFSDVIVVQAQFLLKLFKDRHNGLNFNGIILKNDCPKNNVNKPIFPENYFDPNFKPINLAFISPLWWECKGLGVIVDAIYELEKRNFKYKFHIIGDGPDKEKMFNSLAKLDSSGRIIGHGWLNNMGKVLDTIDLVIVPSLYDSSPNLVLEMVALNKPVLASDIDAHKDMLVHNELLFNSENVLDLCDKIELFNSSYSNQNKIKSLIYERKDKLSFDWDMEFVNIMELTK